MLHAQQDTFAYNKGYSSLLCQPQRIMRDGAAGEMKIGKETEVFSDKPPHCNYIPHTFHMSVTNNTV
jgi:5-deoxy-D-glucuronate isomerase